MEPERLSTADIEAEGGAALPDKEAMSLLDLNVDLNAALDLAAPVDAAVAANANAAVPVDGAVSANILSPGAVSAAGADQHSAIGQSLDGVANANALQTSGIDQTAGA